MWFKRKIFTAIEQQLNSREIIVLTGMRRVGKTTLLRMIYDKIETGNKVFLDLENVINQKLFEEIDYNNIWKNLARFEINKDKKAYIFLDEIQAYPSVVKAIKYMYDHFDVKFFLTGSSSFYLKNLFPESLSGRKFIFELFPLDFAEFLVFKQINRNSSADFRSKALEKNYIAYEQIKTYFDEFVTYGGFPQVVLAEDEKTKKLYLNDIFSSYFEKDVKSLTDFTQIGVFRDLILLLLQRTGTKLDISKIASALNVSRNTIYSYITFLEQTYFFSFLSPYSKSVDREVSGTRKVFACDTGFLNLFARADAGNILENAVFNCIRHAGHVNYYQKRTGAEIDFLLPDLSVALEVKTKAGLGDLNKLKHLSEKLGFEESYIISKEFVELDQCISVVDL